MKRREFINKLTLAGLGVLIAINLPVQKDDDDLLDEMVNNEIPIRNKTFNLRRSHIFKKPCNINLCVIKAMKPITLRFEIDSIITNNIFQNVGMSFPLPIWGGNFNNGYSFS